MQPRQTNKRKQQNRKQQCEQYLMVEIIVFQSAVTLDYYYKTTDALLPCICSILKVNDDC